MKSFLNDCKKINDLACDFLPAQLKGNIKPFELFFEGFLKFVIGGGIDITGSIILLLSTWGLSEVIPLEEYLVDYVVRKITERATSREFRPFPKKLTFWTNWIPFVGDLISSTAIDGAWDVFDALRAFWQLYRLKK